MNPFPRAALRTGLAMPALAAWMALAPPAHACSCGPTTLSRSYEAATWVVVVTVDSVGRRESAMTLSVTVEEQFKGPPIETLALGGRSPLGIASCDWNLKMGERWLLFLAPEGDAGALRWPSTCSGSLPMEADQRVDSERLTSHLAVLRAAVAEGLAAPPDPWLFRPWPQGCGLSKPFAGPAAVGSFSVRIGRADLVVDLLFRARSQHFPDRLADTRDLTVEFAGERHAVPRDGERARAGGVYTVSGERAERLLARLIALRPRTLTLSLDGEFATTVGTHSLGSAATAFEACRTREPLPRAGWLEVWAQPETKPGRAAALLLVAGLGRGAARAALRPRQNLRLVGALSRRLFPHGALLRRGAAPAGPGGRGEARAPEDPMRRGRGPASLAVASGLRRGRPSPASPPGGP